MSNFRLIFQEKALALQQFIETHMKQGYDLASNFHHRARSLVARGLCPHMHTPSMLNLIHSRSDNDVLTINKQSELALFGARLLQQTFSEEYVEKYETAYTLEFDEFM